jgi:hypothetical protein
MITSFEDQTHELTQYEKEVLLPLMIAGFNTKVGVEKCITNPEICRSLKEKGYEISEPRVRKLVFYIRHNNLVPKLIASSKGYWIATDKTEISTWINSLEGRISALQETLEYAQKMIKLFDLKDEPYDNF